MPHVTPNFYEPYRGPPGRLYKSTNGLTFPGAEESDESELGEEYLTVGPEAIAFEFVIERLLTLLHDLKISNRLMPVDSKFIAHQYKEKFDECLPSDWECQLESCPEFVCTRTSCRLLISPGAGIANASNISRNSSMSTGSVSAVSSRSPTPSSRPLTATSKRNVSFSETSQELKFTRGPSEPVDDDEEHANSSFGDKIMINSSPKQLSHYLTLNRIPCDEVCSMRITCVEHPGMFWGVDTDWDEEAEALERLLSRVHVPHENACGPWVDEIQVGGLYLSRDNSSLKRVICQGYQNGEVVVHAIDSGIGSIVKMNDLMLCPPDLVNTSALAIPMCMSGKGTHSYHDFTLEELCEFNEIAKVGDNVDISFEMDMNECKGTINMEQNKYSVQELKAQSVVAVNNEMSKLRLEGPSVHFNRQFIPETNSVCVNGDALTNFKVSVSNQSRASKSSSAKESPIKLDIVRSLSPLDDIDPTFKALVVSVFDPASFTIQMDSLKRLSAELHNLLQTLMSDYHQETMSEEIDASYYAVNYRSQWHRGYMAVNRKPFKVFLVDRGYNIVANEIKSLPPLAFISPHMLAIRCTLDGICPIEGKYWSQNAIEAFEKLVIDQNVQVSRVGDIEVFKAGPGFPGIPLIRVRLSHPIHGDISSALVNKGLALQK